MEQELALRDVANEILLRIDGSHSAGAVHFLGPLA